ncbi:hypothetical protein BWQ96_10304 [Gracilariopsis chorda]|uniref:Uncharacterized protein n=1 Tax=Gracilariopsis chorda TaxID=448386 RepID=A0A2V3ID26_9FLOR|nr:hypothetical protein BWQ96_10304 [Gracilariopsis chorda]|eukprot:PXF39989.1 hypothetical protein BWQ96_10304 [Gracilariopsis chorda]
MNPRIEAMREDLPCHMDKQSLNSMCRQVRLPRELCSKCTLRLVKENGGFKDCKSIYNLDAPGCKAKLQRYVDINPCDGKRASQVKAWNPTSKMQLDYFVYSVCEQCCDCIYKGATPGQFQRRKNENRLFHPERGNCPAHAVYDICKVLPNIRYMALGGAPFKEGWENTCKDLRMWLRSEASKNFSTNHNAKMSGNIKKFLRSVNVANQCGSETVWTRCVRMERKQMHI